MQVQNTQLPQNELLAIITLGGGALPTTGCYSVKIWALILGKTDDAIRGYIEKYDVPFLKPGDEALIDAADFRAKFPKFIPSKVKAKRGGNRKKPRG
jgi:hypothetical protein